MNTTTDYFGIKEYKIRGFVLNQPAGINIATSTDKLSESDGDVHGISFSRGYPDVDLGQMQITILQNGKPLVNTISADTLLGNQAMPFIPIRFIPNAKIDIIIDSKTANSLAAQPLILHYHSDVASCNPIQK